MVIPKAAAVTDKEGQFEAVVSPGRYLVLLAPKSSGTSSGRMLVKFSQQDMDRVDEDYERAHWPGGRDLLAALPVQVGSGQTVSVGDIRPLKALFYSARFTLPP